MELEKDLQKLEVAKVLDLLNQMYPDAHCELEYNTPFQLLIATMLSAQTTDKKVNQVTARLFDDYPTAKDFLQLSQAELEAKIKMIGLYRTKAKNILATCRILVDTYKGNIPTSHEELEQLPGVGRKTANVVLSNAFGIPAIAVDTHVFRVSNRIGITNSNSVEDTEKQLMDRIPISQWTLTHHQLIWHGRRVCKARNPACSECLLTNFCKYFKTTRMGV